MIRIALAAAAISFAPTPDASAQGTSRRTCLSPADTREAVAGHKLTSPLAAQRAAASNAGAEALRSLLCRWNDEYIYEITLLRRDGKVMHVNVRASDGRIVGKRGEPAKHGDSGKHGD